MIKLVVIIQEKMKINIIYLIYDKFMYNFIINQRKCKMFLFFTNFTIFCTKIVNDFTVKFFIIHRILNTFGLFFQKQLKKIKIFLCDNNKLEGIFYKNYMAVFGMS